VTLVFDPTGGAHEFLRLCIESIRMQESRDFSWIVSIQEGTHPSIVKLVEGADGFDKTIVYSEAKSLGEHLNQVLSSNQGSSWIHLLCQDDFYTSPNAVHAIDQTLASKNLCILVPSDTTSRSVPALQSRGTLGLWKSSVAKAGINRIGGLSTLAWRTHELSIRTEFNFMADLSLLRQLSSYERHPPLIRNALGEHRWFGQAQFNLLDSSEQEFAAWIEQSDKTPLSAAFSAGVAELYGYRKLAEKWSRYSSIPYLLLRHFGRAAGKLRHQLLWVRSKMQAESE
jgi:hypothetical protein